MQSDVTTYNAHLATTRLRESAHVHTLHATGSAGVGGGSFGFSEEVLESEGIASGKAALMSGAELLSAEGGAVSSASTLGLFCDAAPVLCRCTSSSSSDSSNSASLTRIESRSRSKGNRRQREINVEEQRRRHLRGLRTLGSSRSSSTSISS